MSTTSQEGTLMNRLGRSEMRTDSGLAPYSPAPRNEDLEPSIRYSSFNRPETHARKKTRVLRRFTGYVVDRAGAEIRVALVDDGKEVLYDLPAKQLLSSGIKLKYQPFQMDEIEMETDEGMVFGYRFRALAQPSDAYIEPLDFDEEQKRKRSLVLREFEKTAD